MSSHDGQAGTVVVPPTNLLQDAHTAVGPGSNTAGSGQGSTATFAAPIARDAQVWVCLAAAPRAEATNAPMNSAVMIRMTVGAGAESMKKLR